MLLLSSICHSFFFPLCSVVHRYLPSFPTRRSSDLKAFRLLPPVGIIARRQSRSRHLRWVGVPDLNQVFRLRIGRSEEHTSELQSLRHLVCRLLLEKKKQPTTPLMTSDSGVLCISTS